MLELKGIVGFVITTNPDATIRFYRDLLGFKFVKDEGFAVVFDANGTMLRAAKVKPGQFTPPKYTVLGWQVADIADAVAQLKQRGVAFEHYPWMGEDSSDIWEAPGGSKIAWFKDPDGNLLSIAQHNSSGK